MNGKQLIMLAGLSGAIAVGLGAFGAHGLEDTLAATGRADTFETAVKYHFYHTLAIALIGIIKLTKPNWKSLVFASWSMVFGIIVFSGSLYILSLSGVTWWGAITPLGGVGFIMGWLGLFYSALRNDQILAD
ncbi:MAG TPA: DUF423 domain-containing protein [Algoriphagus sp.]|uniref:DUF423 domain-containing protein n=1 Tax=unclassified Algoriphagus TaxID=2641541 RepID=UPI000C4EA026|nr:MULTISPECIES: DUF423 domain-containing protein [unclassified Algoriphagus]MAL13185.1 hypothetical protein [Algoriphagus sp.]MAN86145.1 hypothetical protein [Algoriphagus sp.]HAD53088.1 DUF423 domain-containing protein [Algoriphagus sp.]HAH38961.1 DUF423 domain-containing protein [Algoriphagus sp.]HAS60389.1 DUF423 domain-containing protein [Algoriphagus sp.]